MAVKDFFRVEGDPVVPDNLPGRPVGTLAEIRAEGLDETVTPCCARPISDGRGGFTIRGCQRLGERKCKLLIAEQSGPRNFGVEQIKGKKMAGRLIRRTVDCFYISDQKQAIEDNGGSLKIIAEEGETYQAVFATQKSGWKDAMQDVVVVPYPRPGDSPEILEEVLKAKSRELERERMDSERHATNLGAYPRPEGVVAGAGGERGKGKGGSGKPDA